MATAKRLLKGDASPSGRDGQAGDKNAGSARSSATCATEDAVSRRPVRSGGQGFVFQQPPRMWFGTDGIRGVANVELTPELALVVGRAVAQTLGGQEPARLLVGRDTRRSGAMLEA